MSATRVARRAIVGITALVAASALLLLSPPSARAQNTCGNPPQPQDVCGVCGGTTTDPNCCPNNNPSSGAPAAPGGSPSTGHGAPGPAGGGCASCGTTAGNPFNPYSGSVTREVQDLVLAHTVGQVPLDVTRHFASRWDAFPHIDYDTPMGDAGNWRHSFQWSILDFGTNEAGQERIRIVHPNGRFGNFAKVNAGSAHMTFLACTHERIAVDGTNYYYQFLDGTKHHFTKWTVGTQKFFRMEATYDPYSNRYDYIYATGRLARVIGPNTNQFVSYTYGSLTNSQSPGNIQFTFVDGVATQVLLGGTFNNWSLQAMSVSGGSNWALTVALTNGFHQYKFVVRYAGSNDLWTTDPDNPIFCYDDTTNFNVNSVAIIDPYTLLTRADLSDGRSVTYSYDWVEGVGLIHVKLARADYEDGTYAAYAYYHPSNDLWRRPLMISADDPHYDGPARAVHYAYQTNNLYSGQVYEERHLVTSQLLARLVIDPGDPDVRQVVDADGGATWYGFTNGLVTTNAVGYSTHAELYGGNGMIWKWTDQKGHTTVYERTLHFGAVTQFSHSVKGTRRFTFTDVDNPFYLSLIVDEAGRTNRFLRDAFQRVTNWSYPDGMSESATYNSHGQVLVHTRKDGTTTSMSYDYRGLLTSSTDGNGVATYFSYDTRDRLSAVSNALGHVTTYTYNWRGLTTNIVYADGSQVVIEYDQYGQVTSRTERAGGRIATAYDSLGRLASMTDPAGNETLYSFDAEGRLLKTTTPLGLVISNTYDGIGRKTRETYSSDGTFNEWRFDVDGVRTQLNRLGLATHFEYTPHGWLQSITDPLNRKTAFGYDAAGNRIRATNALNDAVTYTYDAMNRQTSMRDCAGSTVSNVYDSMGRLLSEIDANGIVSSNAYDGEGRVSASWRGGLLVASNKLNALGWVVAAREASGLMVSNTYDAAGRLLRSYMPDGSYFENTYSNTYLAQSIDRAGRSTRYERDVLGRVTNQVDNATNTVRYGYDAAGNLMDLYDQNGSRTRFIFDSEGRQTGKVYADGITNSYTYDALGRLTAKVDGKAVTTAYGYDVVGNLTNIDYATDTDVAFEYDALNRMTKMVDGVGTTLYAFAGSCTKVASVDGPFANDTVSYGYDAGKRLVAITSASSVVQYSFDTLDRMVTVVGRVATNASMTNAYTYLANGRLPDTLTHGNGVLTDYAYDPLFRLTNLIHHSGSTNLASFAYTYNAADLRTSVTLDAGNGDGAPSPRQISYTYDPIGQLTAAQGDFPGYNFDYAFDPAGNPTRQNNNGLVMSNSFNNLNQNTTSLWSGLMTVLGVANITNGSVEVNTVAAALRAAGDQAIFTATNLPVSTGTNTYTAVITDPFGRQDTNLVSAVAQNRGYGYDKNGNMTNDGQFAYAWDNADRLKEVRTAGGSLVMSCKYDGLGRRRERIVATGYTDGPSTDRYVYHDWLVLEVRDGGTNVLEAYTHGPDLSGTLGGAGGIGGILTCSTSGTNRWFHYDGNGNLVRATDVNRTVVSHLEYGPFGTVLVRAGTYAPRFQFSSKEFDAAVGLNYYGYRFYGPKLGRWLSMDPIEEHGGMNLYAFADNCIISRFDPLGLSISLPPLPPGPVPPRATCVPGDTRERVIIVPCWCVVCGYDVPGTATAVRRWTCMWDTLRGYPYWHYDGLTTNLDCYCGF